MDEREARSVWMVALAATLAGGKGIQEATKNADQAKSAYESRFTQEEVSGRPRR